MNKALMNIIKFVILLLYAFLASRVFVKIDSTNVALYIFVIFIIMFLFGILLGINSEFFNIKDALLKRIIKR